GQLCQLQEDGDPIVERGPPTDPVFVLSDHLDFTDEEQSLLDELGADQIRLGPVAIHADQAITIAQNYLDTDGYERY
ncbi:MAG: tRNA (pseudouridine(54)-N(1))-methyltransferase TrmY, partial [Halorhabdus sp.]